MRKIFLEMVRYGTVGFTATILDFGTYLICTRLAGMEALVGNGISYVVSLTWAFYWNRRWTFHSSGRSWFQYGRYWLISLIGLGLSEAVLYVGLTLGYHDLIAKAASVVLVGFWNYSMHRFWTFRRPRSGVIQ